MGLGEFYEASEKIDNFLRLRTKPLAFKLFKNAQDAQRFGWRFPSKLLTCQVINTARIHGRALVATGEDSLCVLGAVALGLMQSPPHLTSGEVFLKLGYLSDPGKAEKYQECFAKLDPVYDAFAVKPLRRANFEPDVILLYGNSAQISHALFSLSLEHCERMQLSMFGESALCGGIAQALITGRPQISIPCYGERVFAGTADDEILMILPRHELPRLISSLESLHMAGVRYPIPIVGSFTSVDLAPVLRTDYVP